MKGEYPVNVTFIDPDRRESTSNSNLYGGADGSRVEIKVVPGDNIYAEYFDRTLFQDLMVKDILLKIN